MCSGSGCGSGCGSGSGSGSGSCTVTTTVGSVILVTGIRQPETVAETEVGLS